MKQIFVGAAAAALFAAVPGIALAQETAGCPDRVAAAQNEFDAAIDAAVQRVRELGGTEQNVRDLLALVEDNNLSEEDKQKAVSIYESSGVSVRPWDIPGDLARINRILHAAADLDVARNQGCDVPPARNAPAPTSPDPEPAPAGDDFSQIGNVPSGGVETGSL